jgi:hypothetical protein
MGMMIGCPHCARKFNLLTGEVMGLAIQLGNLANQFREHWPLVSEYVDCFRPKGGSVTLKRRVRILTELARFFETLEFEYDGKRYRTRLTDIRWAMRHVCDAQMEAFQNHNYIKKMLVNTAGADRVSAEGLTAVEEEERERRRASGEREEREETGDKGERKTLKQFMEEQDLGLRF